MPTPRHLAILDICLIMAAAPLAAFDSKGASSHLESARARAAMASPVWNRLSMAGSAADAAAVLAQAFRANPTQADKDALALIAGEARDADAAATDAAALAKAGYTLQGGVLERWTAASQGPALRQALASLQSQLDMASAGSLDDLRASLELLFTKAEKADPLASSVRVEETRRPAHGSGLSLPTKRRMNQPAAIGSTRGLAVLEGGLAQDQKTAAPGSRYLAQVRDLVFMREVASPGVASMLTAGALFMPTPAGPTATHEVAHFLMAKALGSQVHAARLYSIGRRGVGGYIAADLDTRARQVLMPLAGPLWSLIMLVFSALLAYYGVIKFLLPGRPWALILLLYMGAYIAESLSGLFAVGDWQQALRGARMNRLAQALRPPEVWHLGPIASGSSWPSESAIQ